MMAHGGVFIRGGKKCLLNLIRKIFLTQIFCILSVFIAMSQKPFSTLKRLKTYLRFFINEETCIYIQ